MKRIVLSLTDEQAKDLDDLAARFQSKTSIRTTPQQAARIAIAELVKKENVR